MLRFLPVIGSMRYDDPAADADKNGTVSALEAFTYAQRKTTAYFESEKLLATEHSMIADSGRVDGVRIVDGERP